jgi:hypothetical protein
MAFGPGKYDRLATWARERANAQALYLLVINGNKGSGGGLQVRGMPSVADLLLIAESLRVVADSIEADAQALLSGAKPD